MLYDPASKYPIIFGGTFIKDYPYLLPCICSGILTLFGIIGGYFFLTETLKKKDQIEMDVLYVDLKSAEPEDLTTLDSDQNSSTNTSSVELDTHLDSSSTSEDTSTPSHTISTLADVELEQNDIVVEESDDIEDGTHTKSAVVLSSFDWKNWRGLFGLLSSKPRYDSLNPDDVERDKTESIQKTTENVKETHIKEVSIYKQKEVLLCVSLYGITALIYIIFEEVFPLQL